MSYLEFFSNLVSATAWPVVAVIIVLVFKKEVTALLSRVRKIKHKDSEIDLAYEVSEAAKNAENIPELPKGKENNNERRIERLAEDSPRGAILDSWLAVDEAMTKFSIRYGVNEENIHVPPYRKIETIRHLSEDRKTLGNGVIEMLDRLRRIRNDAVHKTDSEITSETAREYAVLASRVTSKLEEA